MAFEYDQEKSRRNFRERAIDFEFASRIFESDYIEKEDRRRDYGEMRLVAIGAVEAAILVVVYTWREGRRRIISARRANRRERHAYRNATGAGNQSRRKG